MIPPIPDPAGAPAGPFDAVVIGASAGGVQVLGELLPALPADFPVPIVAVLHLPAESGSTLIALFSARCALQVLEASDKEPLHPGSVYFAPAGYHLLIEADRHCALSTDVPVHYSRPSIDVLFESAAWVYGSRLLGVLLTGASADGAAGLAAIRAAGGQTWAQAPDEAYSSTMPASAIGLGVVDRVLTVARMSAMLLDIGHGRTDAWPAPGIVSGAAE